MGINLAITTEGIRFIGWLATLRANVTGWK
jgi:hypothetical protein